MLHRYIKGSAIKSKYYPEFFCTSVADILKNYLDLGYKYPPNPKITIIRF